jgi:hypothetical protein
LAPSSSPSLHVSVSFTVLPVIGSLLAGTTTRYLPLGRRSIDP